MTIGSRYHRFFTYAPALSNAQLQYFTDVDQINHVAWAAVAADPASATGFGVSRFIRSSAQPEVGEFAVTVIDAMQRKGLGRALLAMLHLLAVERGIQILRAVCLSENRRMVSWLCRLGAESKGCSEGTIELDLPVRKSPDNSAPSGSAAERFARTLNDLGHTLAEAREKSHRACWKRRAAL